jgi:hypothetical protein
MKDRSPDSNEGIWDSGTDHLPSFSPEGQSATSRRLLETDCGKSFSRVWGEG